MGEYSTRDGEATTTGFNHESHGKALEERIAIFTSGKSTPSVPSRSASATSFRSNATDEQNLIDQLQSRIGALEYDNERLRSVNNTPGDNNSDDTQLQSVRQERDEAVRRIAQIEAELSASESALEAQRTHSSSQEQEYQRVSIELEVLQLSKDSRFEEMQKKADDDATLIKTLQDAVNQQATTTQQQETLSKTREAEMAVLERRLEKAYTELQNEKSELGTQIEELRIAGQVCPYVHAEQLPLNHQFSGNNCPL